MLPRDAVFHLERKDDELKQNVMRVLRTKKKTQKKQNKPVSFSMFPPDAVFHLERKDDELKQNVMRMLRTKTNKNKPKITSFVFHVPPGCSVSSRKEG